MAGMQFGYWLRVWGHAWRNTTLLSFSKIVTTALMTIVGSALQWRAGLRPWPNTLAFVATTLIAYAVVSAAGFAWNFVAAPARLDAEKAKELDRLNAELKAAQRPDTAEMQRRRELIRGLRLKYCNDGLVGAGQGMDMRVGAVPLPKEWVEKQLAAIGETWTQERYL